MQAMFLKAAEQKGALQPGACLCKYVRLPDDVTAEDASCSLIQCVCMSVCVLHVHMRVHIHDSVLLVDMGVWS